MKGVGGGSRRSRQNRARISRVKLSIVVSRVIFDDGMLQAPPHPPAPLPQRGEGRVDFTALSPLGVARRGVFISRGETGEGVSPIVKSNIGHHTSWLGTPIIRLRNE
jgi:hypothetical protein